MSRHLAPVRSSVFDPEPRRGATRSNNRLGLILDAAAELFASKGFRETTMRDIAARSEMLPGSIYYHFASKDDVLVAVYEEGVRRLVAQITRADPGVETDPWHRLEVVMAAHLETILDGSDYARVIIRVVPDAAPKVAARLIELRDAYEGLVAGYVSTLPLASGVDPTLFRLFLLGAANHAQLWRRDGPCTPTEIAVALVRMLRMPSTSELEEERDAHG